MPTIAGDLQTCTEDCADCAADLVAFSCGDGRNPAERAVEQIVSAYAQGAGKAVTLRVTREQPGNALVGLVALGKPGLVIDHPLLADAFKDAAYVSLLTLAAAYRGGYRTKDGRMLSQVLLADALTYVDAASEADEMPFVQAIIEPGNTPSRTLFESYGFESPIETKPDLWYVRPQGLALDAVVPDPPGDMK